MPRPADYAAAVSPTPLPLAAASPKIAPSSVSESSSSTWLGRINFFRAGVGLDPIRENADLSSTAAAHARYLLLNFAEDIRSAKPMSAAAYQESPGKSGYAAKGALAASNLQLAWGCTSYDAGEQIDHWIEGPFHRLAMLDPFLTEAGFGQISQDGCWVATLRLPPPPEEVKPYARAVEFPPDGAAVALDWAGLEAPDPLASCPGFERPVGLPITLQIGRLADTKLTAHSLMEDGKPIEHCAFDAPSYRNPNPTAQEYGRWNLRNATAVVIIPRLPLRPGSHYSVSITANNKTYAWSFTNAESQTTTFAEIARRPAASTSAAIAKLPAATTFTEIAALPTSASVATPAVKPARIALPRRAARPHRATPAPAASPIVSEIAPIIAAPPSPAAEAAPETPVSGTNWLAMVNLYRSLLKLPQVEEDPALSQGCRDHAKYLVTNYESMLARGWNPGGLMHTEDESKPGYTPDGIKAARASDVMFQAPEKFSDNQRMTRAIESWIAGPFHRPSLVNPDLRQVGFGQYCGRTICAASLDWRSDLEPSLPGGHPYPRPIEVPPDGATVKPSGFGNEWPSPISPCPGYPYNAPAITIQVGINMAAMITDASLTQITGAAAGTKVGTCAYDFQKYTNPDPGTQAHGREVLKGFGVAVMMVRDPLIGGETYQVDMTVNGTPYRWSLTAAK